MIAVLRDCCRIAILLIATHAPAAAELLAVELLSAELAYVQETREPVVNFRMSETSARSFAELTSNNIGRKLVIRVDGEVLSAPVIRSPILGGVGQISAPWSVAHAKAVAEKLATGKAKLEFEIVP